MKTVERVLVDEKPHLQIRTVSLWGLAWIIFYYIFELRSHTTPNFIRVRNISTSHIIFFVISPSTEYSLCVKIWRIYSGLGWGSSRILFLYYIFLSFYSCKWSLHISVLLIFARTFDVLLSHLVYNVLWDDWIILAQISSDFLQELRPVVTQSRFTIERVSLYSC